MLIAIDNLRLDGGTQPRAGIDTEVAYDYGDEMTAGAKFPPVVAFYDGESYWLADGFHRVEGARSARISEIDCDVRQGTVVDARWFSYSANKGHGLRRSNDDKHRAVKAALCHPDGAGKSNRQIAKHVGVDDKTVQAWREDMESTSEIPKSVRRIGSDGRMINTANIGRRQQVAQPAAQAGTTLRSVADTIATAEGKAPPVYTALTERRQMIENAEKNRMMAVG